MWKIMVTLLGIVFVLSIIHILFVKPKQNKVKRVNVYTEEQKEQLRKENLKNLNDPRNVRYPLYDFMLPRKNLYRWKCTVCGRIYYHRWGAQYCNHGQTLLSKIKSYFDKK